MNWRWLDQTEQPTSTAENMALDEAILESFLDGDCRQTVRVYRWIEPCVTYGRHQDVIAVRGGYPYSALYRRPTGGRAVIHGDDLTVTVVADEKSLRDVRAKRGILASYNQILSGVVTALAAHGIFTTTGSDRSLTKPIDCFAVAGKCDLVDTVSFEKIVGSAQYRSRGAILQQMSIRGLRRYHIDSLGFTESLKCCLAECLNVDDWEMAKAALPSEHLRSTTLMSCQIKGADCGTKNSYV